MAYLGCAAALGYGVLKLVWSLGGTIGLRHHERLHVAPAGFTGLGRLFDYWGTPILAGLAVVILLGLVYPWGNTPIVRPLLRALAWAGTLVTVAGVGGLILMIQYYAGDLSPDRLVDQAGHVAIQPHLRVRLHLLPGPRRGIRRDSLADPAVTVRSRADRTRRRRVLFQAQPGRRPRWHTSGPGNSGSGGRGWAFIPRPAWHRFHPADHGRAALAARTAKNQPAPKSATATIMLPRLAISRVPSPEPARRAAVIRLPRACPDCQELPRAGDKR